MFIYKCYTYISTCTSVKINNWLITKITSFKEFSNDIEGVVEKKKKRKVIEGNNEGSGGKKLKHDETGSEKQSKLSLFLNIMPPYISSYLITSEL